MLAKPVGSHTQHLPLTIFLIVTSLALSTCRVTCGQGRQDQAKRDQVEGPLLNALQSQPTDTNAASVQLPTQLVAPYLSKFDIEVSTEALLKPATLPAAGVPNLITSLELPDTPSLESLFVGEDGKQPPKASPVPNPAMGAFSKAIIETPSKLLLDIPSVQPNQLLATLTANAPPNSTRDQSVGSTLNECSNRENRAVLQSRDC